MQFGGEWVETPVLRGEPTAGTRADGPAIFDLPEATLVLPPGWRGRGRPRRHHRRHHALWPTDMRQLRPDNAAGPGGALRAICEEMGAVAIRTAHSSNIKERRDFSTALFDAAGDWSCRPSTSRSTSARCPSRSRRCWTRCTGRARLDPQRPLPRRHPPARHHPDRAGLRRRRHCRLRGQPRPPRRRRRADAGDARHLARWTRRAWGSRRASRPRPDRRAWLVMRQPAQRLADLRAQLGAVRIGGALPSWPRLRRRRSWRRHGAVQDYAERRTRAAIARCPTAPARPRSAQRPRPSTVTIRAAGRPVDRGRPMRSTSPAPTRGRRQPQLPAGGHPPRSACFFAVRVLTDPDFPSSPRRAPARDRRSPPRQPLNARRPPPWSAATWRRPAASPTSCCRVRPRVRSRARHDEQPHAGATTASPTTRRSAAARAPALTPTARPASTWPCRTR